MGLIMSKSGFHIEFGLITHSNIQQAVNMAVKELREKQPSLLQFFQREVDQAHSVPAKYRVLKSWFDFDYPEEA